MNRRNFFKDALSRIAALLIPSVSLQKENKPIVLPGVVGCEDAEGSEIKKPIFEKRLLKYNEDEFQKAMIKFRERYMHKVPDSVHGPGGVKKIWVLNHDFERNPSWNRS